MEGRRKCWCASELLETQRHGLVLVCYARLAPVLPPIVLADALPSAIPASVPLPIVLADAPPSALLARALLPIVLADALSTAIPALVPYPIVLADAPPSACLLYTSPSPRDVEESRMPSSA